MVEKEVSAQKRIGKMIGEAIAEEAKKKKKGRGLRSRVKIKIR